MSSSGTRQSALLIISSCILMSSTTKLQAARSRMIFNINLAYCTTIQGRARQRLTRGYEASTRIRPLLQANRASSASPIQHPARALLQRVKDIKGIGPSAEETLNRLGINTVFDLLTYPPVSICDWGQEKPVRDLAEGESAIVTVRVQNVPESQWGKQLTIQCVDADDSPLDLSFFVSAERHSAYLRNIYSRIYQKGSVHRLHGKVSKYRGRLSMLHPTKVQSFQQQQQAQASTIEPVYRLTQGITGNKLREFIKEAIRILPPFEDWLSPEIRQGRNWPTFPEALWAIHNPATEADLHPRSRARERLAFDELLSIQLSILMRKRSKIVDSSCEEAAIDSARVQDGQLVAQCLQRLPFALTDGQWQATKEVWADMAQQERMLRLIQGDVGSGKTVCALLAMLRAVEYGGQAAFLAPTEILAFQHYQTLESLCASLEVEKEKDLEGTQLEFRNHTADLHQGVEERNGTPVRQGSARDEGSEQSASSSGERELKSVKRRPLRLEVLTASRRKGKARKALLEDLRSGKIDILIGTHSLLSDEVVFQDLGLVVIDEEHRFGVRQREKLSSEKHVLYMSATPIPRTLLLTAYGDMEVSRLTELPPRNVQVQTMVFTLDNADQIAKRLQERISKNPDEKVFWVLPIIEANPDTDAGSVIHRYEKMVELLGDERVRMVHGRLSHEAKLGAMRDFTAGTANILVSTSVIEVGVDVPKATICIIENAEHFGLSQLHQLRGRIGRANDHEDKSKLGKRDCWCVLLYDASSPSSDKVLQRLLILKDTSDGFKIAAEDLKLRGPGDLLGNKQSGHKSFRLADLQIHHDLLQEAHSEAQQQAMVLWDSNEAEYGERRELMRVFMQAFDPQGSTEADREEVKTRRKAVSKKEDGGEDTISSRRIKRLVEGEQEGQSTDEVADTGAEASMENDRRVHTRQLMSDSQDNLPVRPQGSEEWVEATFKDRYLMLSHKDAIAAASVSPTGGESVRTAGTGTNAEIQTTPARRIDINLEKEDVLYIIFDCETTGFDTNRARIVQIGAKVLDPDAAEGIPHNAEQIEELFSFDRVQADPTLYAQFVDPGVPIPPEIAALTGISQKLLREHHAKPIDAVWKDFTRWLNAIRDDKPIVLIAHSALYDYRMLKNDLARNGIDSSAFSRDTHIIGIMDTLPIFRNSEHWSINDGMDGLPVRPVYFKLSHLFMELFGHPITNAHSAHADVLGLEALLTHSYFNGRWQRIGSSYVTEMGGLRPDVAQSRAIESTIESGEGRSGASGMGGDKRIGRQLESLEGEERSGPIIRPSRVRLPAARPRGMGPNIMPRGTFPPRRVIPSVQQYTTRPSAARQSVRDSPTPFCPQGQSSERLSHCPSTPSQPPAGRPGERPVNRSSRSRRPDPDVQSEDGRDLEVC